MSVSPLFVDRVSKTYRMKTNGLVQAVKKVSFDLKAGEIFGLLGPNGAGKTSIINMITSLEPLSEGDIRVFGESVRERPQEVKKLLGVVHQELITHGFFNLEEILSFHSGYYGRWRNQERINYVLKSLGLDPHRKKMVKQLSGGMKRRLMIAKALLHEPKLLLLDEPTAGVDVELRNSLWEFVRELKAQGMTILLTTHYLQEAEALCDRVGILNLGEMKHLGPTAEVIRSLTKKRVQLILKSPAPASLLQSRYFVKQLDSLRFEFALPSDKAVGEFLSEVRVDFSLIQDIKTRDGSLEEAFLNVVSSSNSNSGGLGR
ncbi:MAG: ABC transporter ATP-binding protein [Bdellovibrio sp.]